MVSQQTLAPGIVAVTTAPSDPKAAALSVGSRASWRPAIALTCGFIVMMSMDPTANLHTPMGVLLYIKTHVWGFLVAQVMIPTWRAYDAYRAASVAQKNGDT